MEALAICIGSVLFSSKLNEDQYPKQKNVFLLHSKAQSTCRQFEPRLNIYKENCFRSALDCTSVLKLDERWIQLIVDELLAVGAEGLIVELNEGLPGRCLEKQSGSEEEKQGSEHDR